MHHAIFPNAKGRSVTADLQLLGTAAYGVDPAILMASAPLVTWATALYEEWIPAEWLTIIANQAIRQASSITWNSAGGPAAVVVLSLKRLGWTMATADDWITPKGTLSLSGYGPREIKTLSERAARFFVLFVRAQHLHASRALLGRVEGQSPPYLL